MSKAQKYLLPALAVLLVGVGTLVYLFLGSGSQGSPDPLAQFYGEMDSGIQGSYLSGSLSLSAYNGPVSTQLESCMEENAFKDTKYNASILTAKYDTTFPKTYKGDRTDIRAELLPVFGYAMARSQIRTQWYGSENMYEIYVYPGDEAFWYCYLSEGVKNGGTDFFTKLFSEVAYVSTSSSRGKNLKIATASAEDIDIKTEEVGISEITFVTTRKATGDEAYRAVCTTTKDYSGKNITTSELTDESTITVSGLMAGTDYSCRIVLYGSRDDSAAAATSKTLQLKTEGTSFTAVLRFVSNNSATLRANRSLETGESYRTSCRNVKDYSGSKYYLGDKISNASVPSAILNKGESYDCRIQLFESGESSPVGESNSIIVEL